MKTQSTETTAQSVVSLPDEDVLRIDTYSLTGQQERLLFREEASDRLLELLSGMAIDKIQEVVQFAVLCSYNTGNASSPEEYLICDLVQDYRSHRLTPEAAMRAAEEFRMNFGDLLGAARHFTERWPELVAKSTTEAATCCA